VLAVMVLFVRWYEEPTLGRRYGADYEAYRRAVPGWWPRRGPWRPSA
jgi:protein-S-isoprenylcysteine O-methyltransferase Ste14